MVDTTTSPLAPPSDVSTSTTRTNEESLDTSIPPIGHTLSTDLDRFTLPTRLPNLLLRPPRLDDGENMQHRVADRLNTLHLPHLHSKATQPLSDVEEWIKLMRKDFGTKCLFLLVELDGEVIGESGLGFLSWREGETDAGVMLSHQHWGRGYGYEALRSSIAFAFEKLGMERVNMGTLEDNEAMRSLARKSGAGEGERRRRKDGRWERVFVLTPVNFVG